jgi:hypothetical protein
MSACNGFATTTASYLFTDAAFCKPKTFEVMAFGSKVGHVPQCNAAFSATGNAMVISLFSSALAECNLDNFDDLISESPDILRKYIRKLAAHGGTHF